MDAAKQAVSSSDTAEPKLKIDKFSEAGVTCLKFAGTVDEEFDGKKLAGTIKCDTLVLDLATISKISSFGIREWVDFITTVGERAGAIVLVECAPKVVDQLNMVANFAGKGRVFSFYAPYRCDYCDHDGRALLQFDRDYEAIKGMKPPERPCANCGNPEYFDEDPTSFFSFLAAQARFELAPEVAAFLAAKLDYQVSDSARRLRVEKHVEGRSVYLKLSGDLDGSFPREKLAEGMEGTVVIDVASLGKIDPAGAAEWRTFMTSITPPSERIFLHGCPPVFLERLAKPEDLGPKAQVFSFALPYACKQCATTASLSIDVEQHFDVLKFATPPELKCADCGGPTTCAANETLLSQLTSLTKPTVDKELRAFIKEVLNRKPEKPQIATTVAEVAASGRRSNLATLLLAAVLAAAVAVGVVLFMNYKEQARADQLKRARDAVGAIKNQSAPKRPAWISTDVRLSGSCADSAEGLSCVGVSTYSDTQEEGQTEASEAALEAYTNALDQKIGNDPLFAQQVRKIYSENRQRALADFENARLGDDGAAYDATRKRVRDGRHNVTVALKKTASTFVPTQATDTYWEEYTPLVGAGSKFLVFVRYTFTNETNQRLVERYASPVVAEGAKVVTAFPAVAWRFPEVSSGAVIVATTADGAVGQIGLQPQYVVLMVKNQVIGDADAFATAIQESIAALKANPTGGDLPIEVKRDDGPPVRFSARVQGDRIGADVPVRIDNGRGSRQGGPRQGGMNVWQATGGGSRDNPED